jgi:hypothetical protein
MAEFKKGDVVVLARGHEPCSRIGDIGTLISTAGEEDWLIDLNQNEIVEGDGRWYCSEKHFIKIYPQPKEQKVCCYCCGKKPDE